MSASADGAVLDGTQVVPRRSTVTRSDAFPSVSPSSAFLSAASDLSLEANGSLLLSGYARRSSSTCSRSCSSSHSSRGRSRLHPRQHPKVCPSSPALPMTKQLGTLTTCLFLSRHSFPVPSSHPQLPARAPVPPLPVSARTRPPPAPQHNDRLPAHRVELRRVGGDHRRQARREADGWRGACADRERVELD